MIDLWFPLLHDNLSNHEAQLEHFLALPYLNKVSGILHSQLCTLRLIYQTSCLMLQPLDSKDSLFPYSLLYTENIHTKQYFQYDTLICC